MLQDNSWLLRSIRVLAAGADYRRRWSYLRIAKQLSSCEKVSGMLQDNRWLLRSFPVLAAGAEENSWLLRSICVSAAGTEEKVILFTHSQTVEQILWFGVVPTFKGCCRTTVGSCFQSYVLFSYD
ncbi:PREDICTED: uncharacterized protein LOC109127740 isoform X1 [Camelina sativa]|uniref:Uncharacterized protein LOC109127740 isoform X1 n=1 Tax=Camelina sativa TaxID=90675 RepID=A0ABM1QPX9_CAMSA|nr:PREDICTED: uncharacterized protein LOC109127740 isoform X1 [Camelina sativa]